MNLYLLGLSAQAEAFCRQAAEGASGSISCNNVAGSSGEVASSVASAAGSGNTVATISARFPDFQRSTLIVNADYFLQHIDEMCPLSDLNFLQRVILAASDDSAEIVSAAAGSSWEILVAPTVGELRGRLSDWSSLDSVAADRDSQAQQLRNTSTALETASQELSSLRQKVASIDRQQEQLSTLLETQGLLSKLSQEINCLDLDEIITICVTKIPLLVNARYASFYLHNVEDGRLELKRHNHGYRIDDVVRLTEDNRSAMAQAVRERRIVLVRDFDEYEKVNDIQVERPNARRYASRSALIAPMLAGDRVVAVLNLADKRSGTPFDEGMDLPPIEQIAALVGTAIRNFQLYQEVGRRAKCDAMTGFFNHQTFFDEMEKEVLRVRRYRGNLSVLMIDVDRFKTINDTHGHQIGDQILTHVSKIIQLNVRDTDIPARYGGDEFAVILSEADITRGKLVAERIREMVEAQVFSYEGKQVPLSISVGVSQYRAGMSVLDFVNEADQALYEAKAHGRNRVESMHPSP